MTAATRAEMRRPGVPPLLVDTARDLFPGHFAPVMATGVVSIACQLLGLWVVAVALVGIAWVAYLMLGGLTAARIALFPRRIAEDLSNHQRAPGFFTLVAGTCVFGTQTVVVAGAQGVGSASWYLGLGLWFLVMYAFFTAVTIRARKPTLAAGINGAWLIAAVATQSIVVLKATLGAAAPPPVELQFLCLAFFMIACMPCCARAGASDVVPNPILPHSLPGDCPCAFSPRPISRCASC